MEKELSEGEYILDTESVAYKDGICYPVEVSSNSVMVGNSIGNVRVLTIDDEIVAKFYPLNMFSEGYKLLYVDNIEKQRIVVEAYDTLIKK